MVTEEELQNMSPEELLEFQKKNCVFCQIAAGKIPAKKVFEDEKAVAVLDINPANLGHVLLLPKEHYAVLPQVPDEEIRRLFMLAKGVSQSMLKAFKVRGTTIFVANGVAAGQKAPHVLIHVIPRSPDDGLQLGIPVREGGEAQQKKLLPMLRPVVERAFGKEAPAAAAREKGTGEGKGERRKKGAVIEERKKPAAKKKAAGKSRALQGEKEQKQGVSLDDIAGLFK